MITLLASLVFRCLRGSPMFEDQTHDLKSLPPDITANLLANDSVTVTNQHQEQVSSSLLSVLTESDKQALILLLAELAKRQTCAIKKEDYHE